MPGLDICYNGLCITKALAGAGLVIAEMAQTTAVMYAGNDFIKGTIEMIELPYSLRI